MALGSAFEEGLGERVGPFRTLFNETFDIVHPLRFTSGMGFDVAFPLNRAFGLLTRLVFPNSSMEDENPLGGVTTSPETVARRNLQLGAYLVGKFGDRHNRSRAMVTAFRDTNNLTTAAAEYKRSDLFGRASFLHMRSGQVEAGALGEYTGSDYTIGAGGATDGSAYLSYHQRLLPTGFGSRFTAGGEVLLSDLRGLPCSFPRPRAGPAMLPGLSYSLGGSYRHDDEHRVIGAVRQLRMGPLAWHLIYLRQITDNVLGVSTVEHESDAGVTNAFVGVRARFPRTRSVFTASLTSEGGIRGEFERRLLSNVRASLLVDSNMWPAQGRPTDFEVALRVQIGSHPKPPLNLTPLLMRHGPRALQK